LGSLRKIRVELGIFFTLFATYSYFHQGGGWNQNSRFDQVRAIVEGGEFQINNYMTYRLGPEKDGNPKLSRLTVPSGIQLEQLSSIANTGDVALFDGRIYPNKPPGTVLSAVPAYFVIYHVERALGIGPDDWWPFTINAYLTTVFSVGLLAALGGVAFYRVSLRLFPFSPAWTHVASTFTFSLGTLMLPFATMLFDHDIVAALSLFGFWLLIVERDGTFTEIRLAILLFVVGILSGLAVVTNYVAVITVVLLTVYTAWIIRPQWKVVFVLLGLILPLVLLGWYHFLCFGSPLANATTYQSELFKEESLLLFNMFGLPRFDVMVKLLFSSYRGLFFTSPVLILSCLGFWQMALHSERRAEITLFVAIFLSFLLMNSSVHQWWHSGASVGPRYLIPAIPFLTLPLALVFEKWPRTTLAVAPISVMIMLLATAVDPQPFDGFQNPLSDYILPLAQGNMIVLNSIPIRGPVSANPIGVYEPWFYTLFQPGTIQTEWNSFNLGEFFWPSSLSSLVPLLSLLAFGVVMVRRWTGR
jgi:hypothetical protein